MTEENKEIERPPRARTDVPMEGRGLEDHHALINPWLEQISQVEEVKMVWLVGSMAYGTATPGSDIDLFIAVEDHAYDHLWGTDQAKMKMLEAFGSYYPMANQAFVRVLSETGVIIELGVHKVSELKDVTVYYKWKTLLCRLPDGPPQFRTESHARAEEGWPSSKPLSPQVVARFTQEAMFELSYISAPFYNHEYESAITCVDKARLLFLRVLYRHLGLRYAKKYKRLSTVLPDAYLAHYRQSFLDQVDGHHFGPPAAAAIRIFTLMGKYLQSLGEKAGGGFNGDWYNKILAVNEKRLNNFLEGEKPAPQLQETTCDHL